jgi:hypothetical protein
MQDSITRIAATLLLALVAVLAGCGGTGASQPNYTIGGSVAGLPAGDALVLADNGGDDLTVSTSGGFTFATPLAPGSTYDVSVLTQPKGASCTVADGSGQLAAPVSVLGNPSQQRGDVTSVAVNCTSGGPFTVGGTVAGLIAGRTLVLLDNGGNAATIAANGSFKFSTALPGGSPYTVTVGTQPPGQTCTITGGSGASLAANVSDVSVVCADQSFEVAAAVSGLSSSKTLVLQLNGANNLTVSANGTSDFAVKIASNSTYAVTVLTQPVGETCVVTGGSGTVDAGNVTVPVACTSTSTNTGFTVGGTVSGLAASTSVTLLENGQGTDIARQDGSFTFSTLFSTGQTYTITVQTQPTGQTCAVANGTGTIGDANVTNVTVTCTTPTGSDPFVWVGGPNSANGTGSFGTQGTAAPGNVPPPRAFGVSWQDSAGNFWLFAGSGVVASSSQGNLLSDIWEYSPGSGSWTWVGGSSAPNVVRVYGTQGVAAAGNTPGGRSEAASWVDAAGNLWVFGGSACLSSSGLTCNSATLNDLWKYTPGTGLWTWVGGGTAAYGSGVYGTQGQPAAGNVPGARFGAATWVDKSGNFWLLGGNTVDVHGNFGPLNDLWKYSPTANEWTWIGGSNTYNGAVYAVYGTNGVPTAGSWPGAIETPTAVTDAAGNFWMFGGYENVSDVNNDAVAGLVNDVWEYSPTSGLWTSWTNLATAPSGRWQSAAWEDAAGDLWIYGGEGQVVEYGDLWQFVPGTGTWTMAGGVSTVDPTPSWGTLGTPSASNEMGSREGSATWIDASGKFWLFGGNGVANSEFTVNVYNDLWQITP